MLMGRGWSHGRGTRVVVVTESRLITHISNIDVRLAGQRRAVFATLLVFLTVEC